MITKENIKKIYDNWSPEEQKNFLQKCYLKLMSYSFECTDDCVTCLKTPHKTKAQTDKSYIHLSGKEVKDYGCFYLEHYATKEEKEQYKTYSEYLKMCYTIAISTKGDDKQKKELIQENDLKCTTQELRYYSYKYCYLIKGMDKETAKKTFSFKKMHRYEKTLEQLIELDDEEKIIEVIGELAKKEKNTINPLEQYIRTFIKFNKTDLPEQEKEKLRDQLSSKLKIYETYKDGFNNAKKKAKKEIFEQQRIQKEQSYLPKARQIIEDFNNVTASIRDYCKLNNFPVETFRKALSILQKT